MQRELKVSVDKIMSHISIYHDKKVQAATSEASVVAAGIWKTPLEGETSRTIIRMKTIASSLFCTVMTTKMRREDIKSHTSGG